MSNNTVHNENEKLLKIFAGIRCLNRDQLPRYLQGRLTDIEKHLVEQHLVDCDLCFEALQALQQEGQLEQYQGLSANIQQYIRESIKPVSQLQKMERYVRKTKQRESMLIYFWLVAFIVGGGAILYLMQQYNYHKPVVARPVIPVLPAASVAAAPLPPPADSTSTAKPAPLAAAATPPVIPVVKKDTVKAAPPPAKKLTPADSAKKAPPPKTVKDTVKRAPDSNAMAKPAPARNDTPAATVAHNNTPKKEEKKEESSKPAASSSTAMDTDEFLYKAAMVYQQQGDLNEAINRYKRLSSSGNPRIGEMARYQMGVCYRNKGQNGKARRIFKEVVRMDGNMKQAAQQALDNL
ncbi:tetratricopeptide repeat protein [Chitinophaga agrisoli]|uniref:Tetratricopeptide repeat protein n=1 Tax=Chitinophaga agrisoli TaxID=2607653 RepID=A0A5B2VY91_9BACT|nr:tetratricopeptide repeat protein [Chitinophaga agrisoli]KAA2243126.1 tetratricopeptide repeat protein [Chitinophaga agrisoli]